MTDGQFKCPLCGNGDAKSWMPTRTVEVECERCGRFAITMECLSVGRENGGTEWLYLPAATRQATAKQITLTLNTTNWQEYARQHSQTPISQKIERVMWWLGDNSGYAGSVAKVRLPFDYPLFDMRGQDELSAVLKHLSERGLIELRGRDNSAIEFQYSLTVAGFQELEPKHRPGGEPGRCFVAMSFSDDLDTAYFDGIKPAIEACGFISIRLKELHHNSDITDRLLREIRRAQFTIADFTQQKAGVYYEAGFARALGREVIMTCRSDDFDNLHFDTNHLSHIKWLTSTDLRARLADRIQATILPKG